MARPNILFILADQFRADCLSCAGHPVVKTPNLDRLASTGVRFDHAFVQSPVCGPSRMSLYTGRYVHAHRSSFNTVPLPATERTMADELRQAGYEATVIGRTHFKPDPALLERPDRNMDAEERAAQLNGGFPHDESALREAYNDFRAALPVEEEFDGTVRTPQGDIISPDAWAAHADYSAAAYAQRIRPEHMYDSYKTDRAIDYIRSEHNPPWLLYLSLDLPHPPFQICEPYHSMYDHAAVPPPVRRPGESESHPMLPIFRRQRRAEPLDDERTWRTVRATYYGMCTYIDAQVGRVLGALDDAGLADNTVVMFVADHGEYLGDHWMAEKELFYDQAIAIPMMLRVPGCENDASRGTVVSAFVEAIDVMPTFLDAAGVAIPPAVQGRSLLPLLNGEPPADWRDAVFVDWDYQFHFVGEDLGIPRSRRRAWMIRDAHFKYAHFLDLPPMLFDLKKDPQELHNVADQPQYAGVVAEYQKRLLEWRLATEDQFMTRVRWREIGHIGDFRG